MPFCHGSVRSTLFDHGGAPFWKFLPLLKTHSLSYMRDPLRKRQKKKQTISYLTGVRLTVGGRRRSVRAAGERSGGRDSHGEIPMYTMER